MDMTTTEKLETYIKAELGDAALYKELSKIALNEEDRKLLMEFSQDEQSHADEFKRIYYMLTRKNFNPEIQPPVISAPFRDVLRERVLDESGDFRKYGEQYLTTNMNTILKDAYYRARTDENVHALRLLYMLSKETPE